MRRVAAICAGSVGLLLSASQFAGAARLDATYTDPAGDAGTALDLTQVEVANDTAGRITFRIPLSAPTVPSDATIFVLLDTDQNPASGAVESLGAEYLLVLDGATNTFGVLRWDGATFANLPSPGTTGRYSSGLQISIAKGDYGIGSAFNFWIRTAQEDGGLGKFDDAPNDNTYTYTLPAPPSPPALRSVAAKAAPAPPVAGRRFVVSVTVRLSDGKVAGPHRLICKAKVGGRAVKTSVKARGGAGTCSMTLPASARGKRIVVTLAVAWGGKIITKTLSYRAR